MERGAACFGNTKLIHTHPSCWVKAMEMLSQCPNRECARQCAAVCTKPHRGWSLLMLVLSLPSLLQGQPHWWVGAHSVLSLPPPGTKRLTFWDPVIISCVWKVIIKKMQGTKGVFFSLLIPLHLSFASVKWQRYAAAHKSEDVCCISHESCKCCVMSHILVECTRKQAVLLSELSLERGGREKAERFIQVRISKESTD